MNQCRINDLVVEVVVDLCSFLLVIHSMIRLRNFAHLSAAFDSLD